MKPPLFSCLTSRRANNGSLYGRFLFGPLPIDISLTVATVLRRSLLHKQSTFTIVSAEIDGASHEYASLHGIQESVLEILLNLGEIVLTSTQRNLISPNFRTSIGLSPFFFANIRVSGPGIVRSKDINWPKGIFCVKPNSVICTLSSQRTLTMRLKIACSLNKNKQSFYENENQLIKKSLSEGTKKGTTKATKNTGNREEEVELKQTEKKTDTGNSFEEINSKETEGNKKQIETKEKVNFSKISTRNMFVSSQETRHGFSLNDKNQFEFFKLKEKEKEKLTKTNKTLLEQKHFIRIQNKTLFSNKTKEQKISKKKDKNKVLYIETIKATQRLLTKHLVALDSYSIRKEKVNQKEKQEISVFPNITNQETIFVSNKSKLLINGKILSSLKEEKEIKNENEKIISKQKPSLIISDQANREKKEDKNENKKVNYEDLEKNVTFQIFPPFFNDFTDPFFLKQVKKETKNKLKEKEEEKDKNKEKEEEIKKTNFLRLKKAKLLLNEEEKERLIESQKEEIKVIFKDELLVKSSSYPVEKVNFLIERDDELLGYRHRIILEVWTNGSISPRQALFESIGSIIKLIYNFREPLRKSFRSPS